MYIGNTRGRILITISILVTLGLSLILSQASLMSPIGDTRITSVDATPEAGGGDQGGGGGETEGETDGDSEPETTDETEPETTDETEPETTDETEPTPNLDGTPEPTPSFQELVEICDNGQDDDNDGQIDADDSDCTQQTSTIPALTPPPTPTLTPLLTPRDIQGLFGITTTPTPTPTPTPDAEGNCPEGYAAFQPNPDSPETLCLRNPTPPPTLLTYVCPDGFDDGDGDGICRPTPGRTGDGSCPPGYDPEAREVHTGFLNVLCIPKAFPTLSPSPPPSPSPASQLTLSPSPPPFPITPSPTVITNVNNNQVTVQNGRFTVQNTAGAVTATPDCPPQSATVVLGPSPMQASGARILAAFDPCTLTDGTVVLNLPDEQGIQLVAANVQGGQTTQSVVVPMQRIAPITEGQTLYTVDLNGQITGSDPATGNPATLNGNINALFLLNAGGQNVEFSVDNSAALNAILRR